MDVALRPLRLGEILDRAISLYRHNFLMFTGIIALAEIPLLLVQIALPLLYKSDLPFGGSSDIFSAHWFITNAVILFVRWIFVDGLGAAALTYAIARRYLHQETSIFEAYRQLGPLWARLLAISFLFAIFQLMALLWTLVPCIGWFSGPGLLIFLSAAVAPFILAALVLEKQSVFNVILRAWDLARRRFFWILGFNIVLILFNWILSAGPAWVFTVLVTAIIASGGDSSTTFDIYNLVSSVSGTLFGLLFLPIQIAAWTVVYFDLRVRGEAFDLALLTVSDSEDTNQLVVLSATQKLLTVEDMAKFFLVSFLIVGIFFITNILPFLLILLAVAFETP